MGAISEVKPCAQHVGNWGIVLILIVPRCVIGLFLVFMLRQEQAATFQALSFGKSRARMFTATGLQHIHDVPGPMRPSRLQRVVGILKDPARFTAFGRAYPQGVLLVGHSGQRQDAYGARGSGRAGVPFFRIIVRIRRYVWGRGRQPRRDLFDQAKSNSP